MVGGQDDVQGVVRVQGDLVGTAVWEQKFFERVVEVEVVPRV